jgi:hypothetical protein
MAGLPPHATAPEDVRDAILEAYAEAETASAVTE